MLIGLISEQGLIRYGCCSYKGKARRDPPVTVTEDRDSSPVSPLTRGILSPYGGRDSPGCRDPAQAELPKQK